MIKKSRNFELKSLNLPNSFRSIAKTALILVYLVILAGAVVRMTGSGMGCPDWPKCFGYYIPPTQAEDLKWQPAKEYKAGQAIISDDQLLVAQKDFITDQSFNKDNWNPYTKHDYAIFNAFHTWTEFINRLLGAIAGLATLILGILSIKYWKTSRAITIISWLVVFGMIFQGWLGATVVYSVLAPVKITMHMLMALLIVGLLLYIIEKSGRKKQSAQFDSPTYILLAVTLAITLIQIGMGTQVRELVDNQIKIWGEEGKENWLNTSALIFLIHRSFSVLVVLLNVYVAYRIWKLNLGFTKIYWVLGIIFAEVITGIAMVYLEFPFASQPLHLVLATLIFGIQAYLLLEFRTAGKSLKSL